MYKRIVCLTEETTETLYSIGEDWRIVGISGFTVRPPRARREKPKVSAFTSAKIEEILKLRPDLVLGFSDIQADIAAELIRHGVEVHVFNHRSVDGILRMTRTLGAMVGCAEKGEELAGGLAALARALRTHAALTELNLGGAPTDGGVGVPEGHVHGGQALGGARCQVMNQVQGVQARVGELREAQGLDQRGQDLGSGPFAQESLRVAPLP